MVLYGLGVPVMIASVLYSLLKELSVVPQGDVEEFKAFAFLWGRFEYGYFWWELVSCP